MEENGKERRAATKGPLWSFGVRNGKPVLVVNLSQTILILTAVVHTFFCLSLLLACKYLFDCTRFVPTPSYLSILPGLSRLSILATVGHSVLILIATLGGYSRFKGNISDEIREGMLWIGVGITVLLPLLPVLNDINAAEGLIYERLHAFTYYLFAVLYSLWLAIAVTGVQQLKGSLNTEEVVWYWRLTTGLKSIAVLGVVMAVQWKLSYTSQAGFLLNETALGLTSWLFALLLLSFPALISQFFRGFSLYLPLSDSYERVAVVPESELTVA